MQKRNITFKSFLPHPPIIIAHRGASADAPENTLASFKKALNDGAHCIELDVRFSLDGVPIIFHDTSLARITGDKNAPSVHQLTLTELKQYDVGIRFGKAFEGESIPTLDEVLQLTWNTTGLMIEIKSCPQPAHKVVKAVFECLNKAKSLPPFLIIGSFATDVFDAAQIIKDEYNITVEVIGIIEKKEMLMPFIERDVKMIALCKSLISPELIKFLSEMNIDVWSFTVDDIKKAASLKDMGVNGIITNKSRFMLQELQI